MSEHTWRNAQAVSYVVEAITDALHYAGNHCNVTVRQPPGTDEMPEGWQISINRDGTCSTVTVAINELLPPVWSEDTEDVVIACAAVRALAKATDRFSGILADTINDSV